MKNIREIQELYKVNKAVKKLNKQPNFMKRFIEFREIN